MIEGRSREDVAADKVRVKAICYDFLCVSEATARALELDPGLRDRHPNIPWPQVRAIANVLRHGYGRIDFAILWETAAGNRLRNLIDAIQREHDTM